MRRKLFTLASAVSLLLCVATVVLWMKSYEAQFYAVKGNRDGVAIIATSGYVVIAFAGHWPQQGRWFVGTKLQNQWLPAEIVWMTYRPRRTRFCGIGIERGTGWFINNCDPQIVTGPQPGVPTGFIISPLAWLAGLTGILPLISVVRWSSVMRRKDSGFCPCCRYNLTGNTSRVCPECGTAVAGKGGT